jgi:GNAT superfamily N-acetyltransferase
VGIAVLRYRLTAGLAQLAALFVDRAHRQQGIATALTDVVIRLARGDGAQELYVSATPSESAIGFYTSQGFTLAQPVNSELYEQEPDDIHLVRPL